MKKYLYILIISLVFGFSSCDLDRFPQDSVSPETYFNTVRDLEIYTNLFYEKCFPTYNDIYNNSVDDMISQTVTEAIQGKRVVEQTDGQWNWTNIRSINYYLKHSGKVTDVNGRLPYDALARFFRAYEYFKKVARFGDVPWYNFPIDDTDKESMVRPRDPRTLIMDSIVADLDFAIKYLPETKNVSKVSKWIALQFKARVCLYEGTWRKYHTEFNLPDADKFLDMAIASSDELIQKGKYSLYDTGDPTQDYHILFSSFQAKTEEMMLVKSFSAQYVIHHMFNYFVNTSAQGKPGFDKSFVNHYLMKDGTRFTDKTDYNKIQFYDEVKDRDPRLSQTMRTPGYTRIGETVTEAPQLGFCVSGYHPIKYVTNRNEDAYLKNTNPLPVFRYAEGLLIYAEAKAERGTLTQDDLDKTVNLIRSRAGLPDLIKVDANNKPCAFLASQYKQVSGPDKGVILEIRRERTVELIMEGHRWNDILRWKEGGKLPNPTRGMYFPGTGVYDLDKDGKNDICIYEGTKPTNVTADLFLKLGTEITLENGTSGGLMTVNPQIDKKWDETKDYLFPIPIEERLLNPNLSQNPNWDDGLD